MPFHDLFKYPKTPACSEDSLREKLRLGQAEALLEERLLDEPRVYGRPHWKTITFRACELVVMFVCILMFVLGLHWQLNANQHCLELQSFYCRISGTSYSEDLKVTLKTLAPALKQIDNRYRLVQFNGSLDWPSPYRGPPSPEIDAEWDKLEKGMYFTSHEKIIPSSLQS